MTSIRLFDDFFFVFKLTTNKGDRFYFVTNIFSLRVYKRYLKIELHFKGTKKA